MKTHRFVVSDENVVNSHGFRLMTDGIDTTAYEQNPVVLYMHNRGTWKPDGENGSEVIGRAVNLEKKDGQLIAEIEFDEEDEFAKKIAGKVERDFIRMTSVGADITGTSDKTEDLLPGQRYETVTTSTLTEISIADIGANSRALKLSRNGEPVQLKQVNHRPQMDKGRIALSLGMDSNTSEEVLEQKIKDIKLANDNAQARIEELETEVGAVRLSEAENLVDRAIELGLMNEGLRDASLAAFKGDHDGQKATLSKLIGEAEKNGKGQASQKTVTEVILGKGGKPGGAGQAEQSFDYLQKNDPMELKRIRDEEPETYRQLAKEYAAGKRWNK